MARPEKEGLTYFPMDCDIDTDDKMEVVIAKYGNRGFGVIVRLMMRIYRNGYYLEWSEKGQYSFATKVNEPVEYINELVMECLKWDFFHQGMYEQYGILTSRGFQKRYVLAAGRRKNNQIQEEFLLYEEKPKPQKRVYTEQDREYKWAIYFHGLVMKHAAANNVEHLVKAPNLQKWAEEFRLILEVDERDPKELRQIIDWCTADTFWQKNVLSPSKLREKYSDLGIKMRAPARGSGGGSRSDRNKNLLQQAMKEAEAREGSGNGPDPSDHYHGLPEP